MNRNITKSGNGMRRGGGTGVKRRGTSDGYHAPAVMTDGWYEAPAMKDGWDDAPMGVGGSV